MKLMNIFAVLALTAASTASFAAPASIDAGKITKTAKVNYQCQNGRALSVKYGFNAAGIPVTATAKIDGKKRVMRYDLNRSDDVGTYFADKKGYRLSGEAFELHNVRKASLSTITSPADVLVYKSCTPRQ